MKRKLYKNIHYCGNGFKGRIITSRGVKFCGFCGHEFKEK